MGRDYIGYVLAIISLVIGTLVSWHYYEKSVQARRPAFVLDFLPSTIYDAKREARIPLKVLKGDGGKLDQSVHVAHHVFWNRGNQAIVASDVLTQIKLNILDDSVAILSASVSRQSRAVVDCNVRQDGGRSFVISFRILEQDDGCVIKLFYAGDQFPRYEASGDVVGVKRIELSSDTINDVIEKVKDRKLDIAGYTFDIDRFLNSLPRAISFFAFLVFLALYLNCLQISRRQVYVRFIVFGFAVTGLIWGVSIFNRNHVIVDRLIPQVSSWISVEPKSP